MKKRLLCLGLMFSCMGFSSAEGASDPEGVPWGEWRFLEDFDDAGEVLADKTSAPGSLIRVNAGSSGVTQSGGTVVFTQTGPADYLRIDLEDLAENGGGSYVNEYTMVFDIKALAADWLPVYNTGYDNYNAADFWVDGSGAVGSGTYSDPGVVPLNVWVRLVVVRRLDGASWVRDVYVDGVLVIDNLGAEGIDGNSSLYTNAQQDEGQFTILSDSDATAYAGCELANFAYVSAALTPEEVTDLGAYNPKGIFGVVASIADQPSPETGAVDVPYDGTLSWTPGVYAAKHNVYLGTSYSDVNAASITHPLDVLVSREQDVSTYVPDRLDFGQTYFWRIDEVNAPPDNTVFRGDIWSFEVEPVSYAVPIGAIGVTASSTADDQDPNNTINGLGLNEYDEHSNLQEHMWLAEETAMTPSIQFGFEKLLKLDKVHVWNHNSQTEPILGFGIKEALIEYSADGANWIELGSVVIPQATGMTDYTGADVDLGGIMAKVVKITALSNHSILGLPQKGLAEVRFYTIPVQAREPMPADGSTSDGADVILRWRSGREAVEHEVVFSDDEQAVIDGSTVIATVGEPFHDLGTLILGTPYFWKINEMNDLGSPPIYEGDLWSFLTPDHIMLDDMEMYQAQEGLFIWEHWIDGFDNPGDNGAVVGNDDDPEKGIVYEGSQSLPLKYNNTTAPKSEATHTFDTPVDLTKGGAESLKLQVRGEAPSFIDAGDTLTIGASGADLWNAEDEGRFVYKSLSGDGSMTARVESLAYVQAWAKAGVMIRESISEDSADAYTVTSAASGLTFQYRLATFDSAASDSASRSDFWANHNDRPVWVRVERIGDQFNGYISLDGVAWEASVSNPQTIAMISTVKIGLCVTSHDNNLSTVAIFSNISTTGNVTGTWEVIEWGGGVNGHPDNDPAPVYVRLADTAGKEQVIDHPDPQATVLTAWDEWTLPLSELTINTAQLDSITVGVGASGVEGVLYLDAVRTHRASAAP